MTQVGSLTFQPTRDGDALHALAQPASFPAGDFRGASQFDSLHTCGRCCELELQLLPVLALDVGLSFEWAAESSQDLSRTTELNANASLMATLGHSWDLFVDGGFGDVGTSNLPFLAFGFAKRWGE